MVVVVALLTLVAVFAGVMGTTPVSARSMIDDGGDDGGGGGDDGGDDDNVDADCLGGIWRWFSATSEGGQARRVYDAVLACGLPQDCPEMTY